MKEIRLIASDLDGTLLTDRKELTALNKKAIEAAVERGIHFVPCTGRAYTSIPQEILQLPGVAFAITSNGAAIYDVKTGRRIYERLLSVQAVEQMLQLPVGEGVFLEAFVDGIPYSDQKYVEDPQRFGATEFGAQYVKKTRTAVPDVRRFIEEHKDKMDSIMFVCADAERRSWIRSELAHRCSDIHITSSMEHLTEVGHREAGKGNTLCHLLAELGLRPEEAMAFGDADNDADMIAAVRYGIAMEGASESCQKAAYRITCSNEESGVGKMILEALQQ